MRNIARFETPRSQKNLLRYAVALGLAGCLSLTSEGNPVKETPINTSDQTFILRYQSQPQTISLEAVEPEPPAALPQQTLDTAPPTTLPVQVMPPELKPVVQVPEAVAALTVRPRPTEQERHAHLEYLRANINVTPEKFMAFRIDTSRAGAFDEELSRDGVEDDTIPITAHVLHTTGFPTPSSGVDEFLERIKHREGTCCSVQFYTWTDGQVYLLTRRPDSMAYHAQANGMNHRANGNEAEGYTGNDLTVPQVESMIELCLWNIKYFDLPRDRSSCPGHYEFDPIKSDPDPEIADFISERVLDLNHQMLNHEYDPNSALQPAA